MRQLLIGAVATLVFLLGRNLQAQELNGLEVGAKVLSFESLTGGGGSFGFWHVRPNARVTGVFVSMFMAHQSGEREFRGEEHDNSASRFSLAVGPALRRYRNTEARVLPFLSTDAALGYAYRRDVTEIRDSSATTSLHSPFLQGSVGVGIEWFPTRHFSVSGVTGLASTLSYSAENGEDYEQRYWSASFGTFTASLTASLYLPPRREPRSTRRAQ